MTNEEPSFDEFTKVAREAFDASWLRMASVSSHRPVGRRSFPVRSEVGQGEREALR
jgi:hypothetical protein